jgi:hypothetical protein
LLVVAAFLALPLGGCGRAPERISESGSAYEADIAPLGGGIAVVWHDTRDGDSEIYLRMLDAEGHPSAGVHRLTSGDAAAYEPSAAAIDANGLAVAWYTKAADGRTAAYVGAWNQDGSRRWMQPLTSLPSRNPVVRASRLAVFTAWIQRDPDGTESVWRQWWTREGEPVGQSVRLAPASATTWNLNAAVDDAGSAWVVFDAEAFTRASEVFLARDDISGRPLERLTADDGIASKYPDIAVRAGRAAIAWYDERDGNREIYLVIEALERLGVDADARALRVTTTEEESIGAYVAWNEERVGLAWSDRTGGDGGGHEIYFQEFDAGRARSVSERITENATDSLIPAIRAWAAGFVVAWNEYTPEADGRDASSDVAVYFAAGQ